MHLHPSASDGIFQWAASYYNGRITDVHDESHIKTNKLLLDATK
jgi:hypothetical protein